MTMAAKGEFSEEELEKNKKVYLSRLELYKSYGYDNEKERLFIINAAEPFGGSVLEAGTGKGHLALAIAKKGHKLITYDVDDTNQRYARMNIDSAGLSEKVKFLIESKEKLSFKDNSFDTVFCVNTLHHLRDSAIVLDELIRVLSDNGKFILSDFTKKAFDVMDVIHRNDGNEHEVVGWSMDKAAEFLKSKGCIITETADEYQTVYIIRKGVK
ncbi:MAG: class I SAM-dependent methyltransferase [Candidatus Goldbacteria bacterium]|nr:class I SAM-dependent methyltransferase [Candidatus Goldiibacteriota bacterium]